MLSIFGLIIAASSFVVMSDCDQFLNVDKISTQTEIEWDSKEDDPLIDFNALTGKKVLLVVHGYNTDAKSAKASYRLVYDQVVKLQDSDGQDFYDTVIGYLWPGYANSMEYFAARKHAEALSQRMRHNLSLLSSTAAQVDIMAHSMGNRLILEALDYAFAPYKKNLVQNFYSFAAAVNDQSIEKKHSFYRSTQNCQDVYVFHSNRDDVLKLFYPIAEHEEALGYEGIGHLAMLPHNIQFIDCSSVVSGHGEYFAAPSLYDFIKKRLLNQLPTPALAPNMKILGNGMIEVIAVGKNDTGK